MIKKLLAVLMAVSMLAAILPVGAMADSIVYHDDSDMAGVSSIVATETYQLNYSGTATDFAIKEDYDNGRPTAFKTAAALYKVAVPDIPEGKMLDMAQFRATSYSTAAKVIQHAYKLPANLNVSTLTVEQASAYINSSNYTGGSYYIGSCIEDSANIYEKTYRNRYDITSYLKECIAAEQDYFWIAITRDGSSVTAYDHDASAEYWKPRLFYTLSDVAALTYVGSAQGGKTDVYPIGSANCEFSNVLQSATATMNGVEVPQSKITIAGSTVSVDYGDLGLSAACTISVTATDTYSQTASATISFTTAAKYDFWNDSDLPAGIASVQATETYELS